jgi:hypothetical protein
MEMDMKRDNVAHHESLPITLLTLMVIVSIVALAGCAPRASTRSTAVTEPAAVKVIPTVPPPTATVPPATLPPTATVPPAPKTAGDPLVYPGATPMVLSDLANEYCLDALKTGLPAPPVGVPDGTQGGFSYTGDETTQVKDHYATALPAAGWTYVREWEILGTYATSWSKGSDRVVMVIMDNFSEAALARLRDQFGMDIPRTTV